VEKTLIDFLVENRVGSFFFDDPKHPGSMFKAMERDFRDGNYRLTEAQMESATILGQEIIDFAKQKNVSLYQFPEIRAAMGYEKGAESPLNAAELGAFMVGYAMQNSSVVEAFTGVVSHLSADQHLLKDSEGRAVEATDLAVELGRQVYGDTLPNKSSVDTSSKEGNAQTMKKIAESPNIDKQRC
jgi:hypothetical protein